MNQSTKHRGPDGQDVFVDDHISLGHNLLSITEVPDRNKQPMISDDDRYVLTYNGEIYNYLELRKELEEKGIKFKTNSDTEVLFQGLINQGITFINRCKGMFAFAFYDKNKQILTLARDPRGMKPLYYYKKDKVFIFSSEIRGILSHDQVSRKLNHEVIPIFFELGYLPGQQTLISGIEKLKPGQILTINLSTNTINIEDIQEQFDKSDSLENLLAKSVKRHTMGLRPFGMYLSGGIDSSIVLRELVEQGISPTTYTTRFAVDDPVFNEDADIAFRLSKEFEANHTELEINEDDFIGAIDCAIDAIEEPRYHPSIPAYYLMAKHASSNTTVILTGDGGDELFLGYNKYLESYKMTQKYKKYPDFMLNAYYSWKNYRQGKIPFGTYLNLNKAIDRWWYTSRIMSLREQAFFNFSLNPNVSRNYLYVLSNDVTYPDIDTGVATYDRQFWLAEDSLIVSDKIGMHFGMEGRFPMLDSNIVSHASSLSSKDKKIDQGTKMLLKNVYKNKLPNYVLNKAKTGWTAPVRVWMESRLGDVVRQTLTPEYYLPTKDLFDFDALRSQTLNQFMPYTQLSIKRFFVIFMFQVWAKTFKIQI